MKISIRHAAPYVLSLACLAGATFGTPALAQTPASSTGAASAAAPASGTHGMAHKRMGQPRHAQNRPAFVEKRLTDLHESLKITPAQSAQWDAFAQTMRDSATSTETAYQDRSTKTTTLTADESMKSYAALAQLHADNTTKLSTAFSALYASFSDVQKAAADVMFRNQQARHRTAARRAKGASAASMATSSASASAPAPASN